MTAPVRSVDTIRLSIPFEDGGRGEGITPSRWHRFDMVLVRIEDADGMVGWGEAFGYFCSTAVAAAVDELIAPQVTGRVIEDIPAWNLATQKAIHLFGRYGIGIFALSGVDIALWDLQAKREGKSLAEALGGRSRASVPAYASLVRYGDPELVARYAAEAVMQGFGHVKLHEIAAQPIAAARPVMGNAGLMVDVNCNWSVDEAQAMLPLLRQHEVLWLEEPAFPPEDYASLAELERQGIAVGAGENACTQFEFRRIVDAIAYPQPSVTKVGGISVFREIAADAAASGKTIMPHSPYFGPGYFATLGLFSLLPEESLFEFLYVHPKAWAGRSTPMPDGGRVPVPAGPGLGFEPDADVLARYATGGR